MKVNRYALLIGVDRYQDSSIPSLRFAERDAAELAATLSSACGFVTERLLGADATRDRILETLSEGSIGPGKGPASPEDQFLLFFAGHGEMVGGSYVLHPFDARLGRMHKSVPITELSHLLRADVPCRECMCVLDACRNLARPGARGPGTLFGAESARDIRVLAESGGNKLVEVLFGCSEGQRSWEDEGLRHGVLTYHLKQTLECHDPAHPLTFRSLVDEAGDMMRQWWQSNRHDECQEPHLYRPTTRREIVIVDAGVPPSPKVSFRSQPAGAEVVVDAESRGRTPIELELEPGKHEFSFRLGEHPPKTQTRELRAGEEVEIMVVFPLLAKMSLRSQPSGAEVTVDGQYRGIAPLQLELEPGEHELRLELDEYPPKTETREFYPGEEAEITVIFNGLCVEVTATMEKHCQHPIIRERDLDFFPPEGQDFRLDIPGGGSVTAYMGNRGARTHIHSRPGGTIQRWWRDNMVRKGNILCFERLGYGHYGMQLRRSGTWVQAGSSPKPRPVAQARPLPPGLVVPDHDTDKYDNTVRQGRDPDSGHLLERYLEKIDMPMVLCPPGVFAMGSEERDEEKPVHEVMVPAFYMAKYPVTNRQWKQFVDAEPMWRKGLTMEQYHDSNYLHDWDADPYPPDMEAHPVVWVSWFAAKAFAEWAGGRLPTEAEWEKACRAGAATRYCFGDEVSSLGDYAWYRENSGNESHPVGQKKPNAWGLHDMHGSVREWCSSKGEPYPYRSDDGREDLSHAGSGRVWRGGSYSDFGEDFCSAAFRYQFDPAFCYFCLGMRFCVPVAAPR